MPDQISSMMIAERREVRVVGNIDKIKQSVSNYKIEVGRFWFEIDGWSEFSQGERIGVFGTVKRGVIDIIFGQIRLTNAQLYELHFETGDNEKTITKPDFFEGLREKIRLKLRRFLPLFESGLVSGMLSGDKKGLSRSAYEAMIESGTVHIVVASGYNVLLVAGTLMSVLFWLFRRSKSTIIALVVVWFFVLLAGGDPPVVRAAVMIGVLLVGEALGRRSVSWWSLLLAGWVMIMIEPKLLLETSFQLSMAASCGLMGVYPALMRRIDTNNRPVMLLDRMGFLVSSSTMLTTAPIIWWHFGRIGWIGLLSNVLILPFVGVIMVLGLLTLVFGGITAPFLYAVSHWVVLVIRFFGE